MPGGVLSRLPGIVSSALGGLFDDATLTRAVMASDGRGGFEPSTEADHPCKAIISDYSDALRAMAGGAIEERDRKAIVITTSLDVVPIAGDGFVLSGSWRVIAVKSDPANATYELQLRPA